MPSEVPGSDGRRRSADAELWRPCWPDGAKGGQGRSREPRPTELKSGKGRVIAKRRRARPTSSWKIYLALCPGRPKLLRMLLLLCRCPPASLGKRRRYRAKLNR